MAGDQGCRGQEQYSWSEDPGQESRAAPRAADEAAVGDGGVEGRERVHGHCRWVLLPAHGWLPLLLLLLLVHDDVAWLVLACCCCCRDCCPPLPPLHS